MCDRQTRVKNAMEAVKSGMAVRQAVREFGVPRTTLRDKLEGKTAAVPKPRTFLSPQEEETFSDWAIQMARVGFGLTRKDFCLGIQEYLNQKEEGQPRFANNNLPGKSWYHDFMKRHPELTKRSPSLLGMEKALVSSQQVSSWFDAMEKYLEKVDEHLLEDPTRLFNVDETGFALCAKSKRIMAPKSVKGDRHLYQVTTSSKAQITCLCCCSAAGTFVPPLIVMPGQRLTVNPTEHFKECSVGLSESGWMTGDLFADWVENVFKKFLDDSGVKKPVVLFLDGSSTHKTKRVSDACLATGVIPYCLQANATHLLQPLDLAFFASMKHHWGEGVSAYQLKHPGKVVTKAAFPEVFRTAYLKATTQEIGRKGFEKSGLFPLNKDAVLNTQKMQPSQVLRTPTPSTSAHAPAHTPPHMPGTSAYTPPHMPGTSAHTPPHMPCTSAHTPPHMPGTSAHTPPHMPCTSAHAPAHTPPHMPTTSMTASFTCTSSSCTPSTSQTKRQETLNNLRVLESFLTPELKIKYEQRFEEKFDITDDVMYTSWKKCKEYLSQFKMPHHTPSTSTNNSDQHTPTDTVTKSTSTPTPLPMDIDTYIKTKIPQVEPPARKRLLMNVVPNMALTSIECVEYFERRENDKKEADHKKEERLKKREQKKVETEEKKRKAEEKKKQRVVGNKGKNGPGGKKGKGRRVKGVEREEEDMNVRMDLDDSDDDDDVSLPVIVNENVCFCCEGKYKRSESKDWAGCNKCLRWYHKRCVASIDLLVLDDEQLEALDFVCDACLCGF